MLCILLLDLISPYVPLNYLLHILYKDLNPSPSYLFPIDQPLTLSSQRDVPPSAERGVGYLKTTPGAWHGILPQRIGVGYQYGDGVSPPA